MSRAFLALLASVATAIVAAAACQGLPPVEPCGEIPANGCPSGRGGTCDDPTCPALYDCENGQWILTQACPAPDGGTGGTGTGGSDAGTDAGPCMSVSVDAGPPGFGCMPDLISPDCALSTVTCTDTACLTECTDFFVCAAGPCGGGPGPCWVDVAYCTDFGQFIVTGPEMRRPGPRWGSAPNPGNLSRSRRP